MFSEIRELVKKFSKNKFNFLSLSRDNLTVGSTTHVYYLIERFEEKFRTFVRILKFEKPDHALVFANTKKTASWLEKRLKQF